ncbi:hypothetical protein SUGI_1111160 [Cryptomeria japonica]|nr:hypothetical protein SUGI_1111160 [Cryptomeria japonica]
MVIKLENLKLLSIFVKAFPTSKIFCNICKWRSTRDYSGFPYVTRILNCALWVLYGLPIVKPNCILVSTINGIGLGMQIIYTTIFFIFCKDKDRRIKNVMLANGLGAGLAASELLLYALYYSSTEFTDDDQKDAIEMDKSEAGQKNREKLH